jgi:hypothetical protein
MTRKQLAWVFWLVMLGYAVPVLLRMAIPSSSLYTSLLTVAVVDIIGSLIRLAALGLAWWLISLSVRQFELGNPIRPAWLLLQCGLLVYTAAQATLLALKLLLGTVGYPSLADGLFVVAMLILLVALITFVRGYLTVGLIAGGRVGLVATGLVAAIVLAVVNLILLRPVLAAGVPALEKAVNLCYPVLDSLLMVVVLVLLKITSRFRGGSIWAVWMILLAGFACLSAGDILYAYFSTLGMTHLDPVLDVMYTWAYLLMAFGAALNHNLTTGDQPG